MLPAWSIYISESPPEAVPARVNVRFSVYNDTEGFMEIEAAGGCPGVLTHGTCTVLQVKTVFSGCVE